MNMQTMNRIPYWKLGELLKTDVNVTAVINGELFEVEKPQRKTTIQEVLSNLNEAESDYEIRLVDGDTAEIVYTEFIVYALPPCFANLAARKTTVDYFYRTIEIEI